MAIFLSAASSACLREESGLRGSHWTQVNGHKLYYERYGHGRPLVLLHGGAESVRSSFGPILVALAAHHEIIAPEQVGQGHTPDIPGALSYTAMMEDTVALLEQLHIDEADVIGWSDGGNIGLMLAVQHPDRVRRLVVSGANFAPEGLNPEEIADSKSQLDEWLKSDPDGFDVKLLRMWLAAPTLNELSPKLLAKIEAPTLVMSGDHDAIRLDHTVALYQAIPGAQLAVLPDTGHATFQDRPKLTLSIVQNFLDGKE